LLIIILFRGYWIFIVSSSISESELLFIDSLLLDLSSSSITLLLLFRGNSIRLLFSFIELLIELLLLELIISLESLKSSIKLEYSFLSSLYLLL